MEYEHTSAAGTYNDDYYFPKITLTLSKFTKTGFQSMACKTEDINGNYSNYWDGVSGQCGGQGSLMVKSCQ